MGEGFSPHHLIANHIPTSALLQLDQKHTLLHTMPRLVKNHRDALLINIFHTNPPKIYLQIGEEPLSCGLVYLHLQYMLIAKIIQTCYTINILLM